MKHFNEVSSTVEMELWVDDNPPPAREWGTYTVLGPFRPKRAHRMGQVYAARRDHAARHFPKAVKGSLVKWAHSMLREVGDFMLGAFQPIREAI